MNPSSCPDQRAGPSTEFLAVFREHADAGGVMPFARFMELALYHPSVGYYQRPVQRVGYEPGTDFFTASTSGAVFGELVAAACVNLLGSEAAREHTFVEIGAEPKSAVSAAERIAAAGESRGTVPICGVLDGVTHPFAGTRTFGLGERIRLTGKCVVFSNELFDAQPFQRFVFRQGKWRELGVRLMRETLEFVELPSSAPATLPASAPEGYVIDAPLAAAGLVAQIAREPWSGLFVTIDYGKSWDELIQEKPAGTARAYFRHVQSNDLLARPGEQDLTCHVCWDWLSTELVRYGFGPPKLESQESFFIHHAGSLIAATSAAEAPRFSRKKLALLQLLHSSHLGQKFQVLHALRTAGPVSSN